MTQPARKDLLRQTKDYFKAQGIPEIDASILLEYVLQCTRGELQLKLLRMSDLEIDEIDRTLRRLVLRRQNGEPVQYITGKAPFRYLEYEVGPGVLIPRPETESLVALALEEIDSKKKRVIDLGSGSGCIAIAIATESKSTTVTAVEKSAAALPWLQKNVATLAPKVRIIESDVSAACPREEFDVVIANPPYIPLGQILPIEVRKEPSVALFGGGVDGTQIPATFIAAAKRLLKAGGFLAIEHDETQGVAIAQLLSNGFKDINLVVDLTGRPRFTTARKN